jgi:hypothetical protein
LGRGFEENPFARSNFHQDRTSSEEPRFPAARRAINERIPLNERKQKEPMRKSSNPDFQDRMKDAAAARNALLAKLRAAPRPDDPAMIEKRREREALAKAREARQTEREEARKAAEEEAARAAAEAARIAAEDAARIAAEEKELAAMLKAQKEEADAALKAEQKAARDARYAARKAAKKQRRKG